MIEKKSSLAILGDLVSFETTASMKDQIEKAYNYIKMQLSFFPFTIEDSIKNGDHSVIWSTKKAEEYDVILCAHLDVVPASSEELFTMKEDGDVLVGRGVSDMKFAISAFIESLKRLHEHNTLQDASLAIVITADEERGGFNGIKYLVNEKNLRGKVVVLPDGGDNWKIVKEAKGAAWIKVRTTGRAAHASKPWEGENAIRRLTTILSRVQEKYPVLSQDVWSTTVNIGTVTGGTVPNQVPDAAEARLDIRYIANEPFDTILPFFQELDPQADISTEIHKHAFHIDPSNAYIALWERLLRKHQLVKDDESVFIQEEGSADHHYFSEHGIPVILSKPTGGFIHTDHERMDKKAYFTFIDILTEFIEQSI